MIMKKSLTFLFLVAILLAGLYFSGMYDKYFDEILVTLELQKNNSITSQPNNDFDYSNNFTAEQIHVFFSQTYNNNHRNAVKLSNNINFRLCQFLSAAKKKIIGAVHQLDEKSVIDKLINLHKKGIDIKLVVEKKYVKNSKYFSQLLDTNIPIVLDRNRAYMHNKFFVVDDHLIWTGSYNVTYNGTNRNNNNAIVINSPKLAKNYTTEFDEMFYDKKFGYRSPDIIPHKIIRLGDGTIIKTLFAPENSVEDAIIEELAHSKERIFFMAFCFTSKPIFNILLTKHNDGISISGIIEDRMKNLQGSVYDNLVKHSIEVKLDENRHFMHHKVLIIDDETVITGSYNFTRSANRKNDENILIITNPNIVDIYRKEYQRLLKMKQ